MTKVKLQLTPPTEHPPVDTIVLAAFRNPDTGLEFMYPMQWKGDHWLCPRAKEHRGFQTKSPGGVLFLGWVYKM